VWRLRRLSRQQARLHRGAVLDGGLVGLPHFVVQADPLRQRHPAQAAPLRDRLPVNVRHQRPLDRHREIPARRGQRHVVIVIAVHVVVDIDAADKRDTPVDDADLAVGARDAALEPRIEDAVARTGLRQLRMHPLHAAGSGAEPVRDHTHRNAPLRRPHQRGQHGLTRLVVREDIRLEIYVVLRGIDRFQERREVFGTAVQEFDFVVGDEIDGTHKTRTISR
jgi:hypothetical protein